MAKTKKNVYLAAFAREVTDYEGVDAICKALGIKDGTTPRKRTESERTEMAAEFAQSKDWISEGASFSDWVNPILKRATEIHIVSPSRTIRIWRQIKRYIRRKIGIEQTTYRETLRGLMRGIKWTWSYDRDILPVILKKIPKRTKIKKVKA